MNLCPAKLHFYARDCFSVSDFSRRPPTSSWVSTSPRGDLRQAFFYLIDEPLVVVYETLDGFSCQRFGVTSALSSKARELGLRPRNTRNISVTASYPWPVLAP